MLDSPERTLKIEDYALIGDCETAALVGRDGSIDWLCWPRFDSDACFAALLGTREHGCWRLSPAGDIKATTRRYREGTLILETCFETSDGAVRVIDFMPPRTQNSDVVRLVVGERGHVAMRMEFIQRFGYGATVPWVTREASGGVRAVAGPDMAVLRTPVPLRGEDLRTLASFEIHAGKTVPFVLTYGPSHEGAPGVIAPIEALSRTEAFWREWSGQCREAGPWSEAVKRSLITLKALTYAPTGGIVAAATTSLPEQIGGPRNWDYRFCWLRDATLTLLALMNAGFFEEASAWRDWLLRAVAGSPNQMQIMYGLAGERRLTEWAVPWLPGYEASSPVRIGNAAHGQRQLDVFGELMDALHQARRGGLPDSSAAWSLQCALLAHLETIWSEPDDGIWEVRGGRQHFVHSKVMAWVAFDRGIRSIEEFGLRGPSERWRRIRQQIHEEVCSKGYDAARGSFVQAYGSQELDASLLLMPAVGFLPASDPRIVRTVEAIERELMRDGLVLRYDTGTVADGLPEGEGAFLACSFWLADAYVLLGRHKEARALFERLLAFRNDVGLLSEEYDVHLRRQVGNVPQAFSHLALINTAHNLTRASGETPAEQRAGRLIL
jgi:GH15 family glucan-1,4-alpha-glucosidase